MPSNAKIVWTSNIDFTLPFKHGTCPTQAFKRTALPQLVLTLRAANLPQNFIIHAYVKGTGIYNYIKVSNNVLNLYLLFYCYYILLYLSFFFSKVCLHNIFAQCDVCFYIIYFIFGNTDFVFSSFLYTTWYHLFSLVCKLELSVIISCNHWCHTMAYSIFGRMIEYTKLQKIYKFHPTFNL